MSKLTATNSYLSIAGLDASGYSPAIRINLESEEVDITPLGTAAYRETMGGLATAEVDVQVFASRNDPLEQALRAAYNAGTAVDVRFRPQSVAASPTNPQITVSCVVTGFAPFGGQVGDPAVGAIRLASGPVAVTDPTGWDTLVLGDVLVVS